MDLTKDKTLFIKRQETYLPPQQMNLIDSEVIIDFQEQLKENFDETFDSIIKFPKYKYLNMLKEAEISLYFLESTFKAKNLLIQANQEFTNLFSLLDNFIGFFYSSRPISWEIRFKILVGYPYTKPSYENLSEIIKKQDSYIKELEEKLRCRNDKA